MSNPIYILHLTDFHLKCDPNPTFYTSTDKLNLLTLKLKEFLKLKARDHFNIVCLTGDMVHQNGNDVGNHSLAVNYINSLKNEGVINTERTRIYSAPGNHDLDFDKANKRDSNVNLTRAEYFKKLKANENPPILYQCIDEFEDELIPLFDRYKNFVSEIGANRVDLKNNHLYGYDNIDDEDIFVSWFNTSWLSIKDKDWNSLCKVNYDANIRINDHEKLSVGYKVNFDIFNNLPENSRFTLALFHHDTRLLSWHDKYDYNLKNAKGETNYSHVSFYSKVHCYDYVLNGHTHGDLFDGNAATGPCIADNNLENFIIIHEVDLVRNYVIQNKIRLTKELLSQDDIVHRIVVIKPKSFLNTVRKNYTIEDLDNDLKHNLSSEEYLDIVSSDKELELLSLDQLID